MRIALTRPTITAHPSLAGKGQSVASVPVFLGITPTDPVVRAQLLAQGRAAAGLVVEGESSASYRHSLSEYRRQVAALRAEDRAAQVQSPSGRSAWVGKLLRKHVA